jgi:hypothetical protein
MGSSGQDDKYLDKILDTLQCLCLRVFCFYGTYPYS